MRAALLVAGLAWKEASRRPGALISSLIVGVLLAGLLLLVGVVADLVEAGSEDRTYTVAIGGDIEGASLLMDAIEEDEQLVTEISEDPADDVVRRRAAAGLVLPPDLDASIAAGETSRLDIHRRLADARSFQAFALLGIRIQETERVQLTGGEGADPALVLEVDPVLRDERVARIQYGGYMAAVAVLLCVGAVTSVASFFGSARQRRSLEPMLALPLRRWALVAGTAAGYWPIAALGVISGLVMMLIVAALPVTTWAQPAGTLGAMGAAALGGAVALAVLASAAGAVAGSLGTGSDDAVSVGDMVALPFVVAGVAIFLAPDAATGAWAGLIPIYGQATVMRDAITGSFEPVAIAVAGVGTVVWAAALLALAARVSDDEKRLVRAVR